MCYRLFLITNSNLIGFWKDGIDEQFIQFFMKLIYRFEFKASEIRSDG